MEVTHNSKIRELKLDLSTNSHFLNRTPSLDKDSEDNRVKDKDTRDRVDIREDSRELKTLTSRASTNSVETSKDQISNKDSNNSLREEIEPIAKVLHTIRVDKYRTEPKTTKDKIKVYRDQDQPNNKVAFQFKVIPGQLVNHPSRFSRLLLPQS